MCGTRQETKKNKDIRSNLLRALGVLRAASEPSIPPNKCSWIPFPTRVLIPQIAMLGKTMGNVFAFLRALPFLFHVLFTFYVVEYEP